MVSIMSKVKTTIVVDEETWNRFKESVSRHSTLRNLSSSVEEAIKSFNAVELLKTFSDTMGLTSDLYPSIKEVESRRPKLDTSAGKILQEMRRKREARISGFQRRREEVH